jgi:tetratricopeptide (TPR) repeat protein
MQRAAKNNLIFTDFSVLSEFSETPERFGHRGLYQHASLQIIERARAAGVFINVGDALTTLAEYAYAFRRLDLIEDISSALITLPLGREYKSAGRYFGALERIRQGDYDAAETILGALAYESPHRYSSRAIHSLGVVFHARRDLNSALKLYVEAGQRSVEKGRLDPLMALYTQRNIAVIKGANGDHRGALDSLERLLPLARAVGLTHPQAYYDYLNSLAVEYAELGRLDAATRASNIALASPFAPAYPEWQETFDDITLRQLRSSRSIVAVSAFIAEPDKDLQRRRDTDTTRRQTGKAHKLFSFPVRQPAVGAELEFDQAQGSQARVLDFQQWKRRVEPNPAHLSALSPERRREMTTGEKLIRLMDLISHDDTDDETIDTILEAVEEIVLKSRNKKLD